jgi:predicted phosphodiesterase
MRCAILSDVHSNLEATEAVLDDIYERGIRDILFTGDAVGYGPNPNECIELLQDRCKVLIAGNHDRASVGLTDIRYFNEYARHAVEWTRDVLTEKNRDILTTFLIIYEESANDMMLVHSTPKDPEDWHYILTLWDAEVNFHHFTNKFCFIGHSHQPFILEKVPSGELITYRDKTGIKEGSRYLVNAGSVGQPRDGDPRAGYALIDERKVEIIRIPYNIKSVQEKMRREKLSETLIERLSTGT